MKFGPCWALGFEAPCFLPSHGLVPEVDGANGWRMRRHKRNIFRTWKKRLNQSKKPNKQTNQMHKQTNKQTNKQNMNLRLQTSSTQEINIKLLGISISIRFAFGRCESAAPKLCLGIHPRWRLHIHDGDIYPTNTGMMSAAKVSHLNQIYQH